MSLLDRFRKPKEEMKKEVSKKPQVKVVPKEKIQKSKVEKPKTEKAKSEKTKIEKTKEEKPKIKRVVKKEFSQAYRIIKRPIVTEKSTDLVSLNQYAFEVVNSANKPEVKKAVQDLYGVQVLRVNIIQVPGKTRRLGQHEGWHAGYKKALVTLAQGESIEVIAR